MNYLTLTNKLKMPIVGLGTYKIQGFETCYQAIDSALKFGYRLFDTAQVYRNEEDLGKCFKILLEKYKLAREDIFIIDKIATYNHGYEKCLASVKESIDKLQMTYVDLFIIHWPGVKGKKADDEVIRKIRAETWKALEYCYLTEKNVKSIGVSNYTIKHLNELFDYAQIKPHLVQSEYHPLCYQKELVDFCAKNEIVFQAYSSLGTSDKSSSINLLDNLVVNKLAQKYSRKSTQILLRWSVQQNISVIPKSTNPLHIKTNIELFDFTIEKTDIMLLNEINKNLHFCWNPDTII